MGGQKFSPGVGRGRSAQWLGIATIVLIVVLGYWVGAARMRPSRDALLADGLRFPDTWEQHDFQWHLRITNPTSETVQIVDFQTGCECTQVVPRSLSVPAGTSESVAMSFDFARLGERRGLGERIPVSMNVLAILSPSKVASWPVTGGFRRFLAPVPHRVDFRQRLVAGATFPSSILRVECHNLVRTLEAMADSSEIEVLPWQRPTHDGRPEIAGNWFEFEVRPRSDLELGDWSSSIRLVAKGDHESFPVIRVPVVGRVGFDARVTPAEIVRTLEPDQDLRETLTVSSVTGARVRVMEAAADVGDSAVTLRAVAGAAADAVVFVVEIIRPEPGFHDASLRFVVDYPDHADRSPAAVQARLRFQVLPVGYPQSGRDRAAAR